MICEKMAEIVTVTLSNWDDEDFVKRMIVKMDRVYPTFVKDSRKEPIKNWYLLRSIKEQIENFSLVAIPQIANKKLFEKDEYAQLLKITSKIENIVNRRLYGKN